MKHLFKDILATILAVFVLAMPVFALEFDVSVDEEIRKKYNPSRLELEGLPPVPNVKPTKPSSPVSTPKAQPVKTQTPPSSLPSLTPATQKPIISNVRSSTAIKIKSGTKFVVRSHQGVSDSTRIGTRLSFVSQRPVYSRYVTIPQGTVFRGEVIDSHFPQMTGNGGLIVLSIDSMVLNGSTLGIKAKITKANHKKIFVNNIKGKRQYWKNISKQVAKGERFYQKTRRTSSRLANNPIGVIVSPIPTIVGMGGYAVNLVASPIISLFKEGGRISVPAGSEFEIKLLEDVYLY